MTLKRFKLLASLMILATLACRFTVEPTPTLDALGKAVEATSTALALEAPPTPLPRNPCPVPQSTPPGPELVSPSATAKGVLEFLNAGGSVQALRGLLDQAGSLTSEGENPVTPDVNGDGLLDLGISVIDTETTSVNPSGTLYLFICSEEGYRLAYTTPALPKLSAPVIHAAEDLNADGPDDLLIGRFTCGAHTCTEQIEVLIWQGVTLENRLEGTSEDLPTPVVELEPQESGPAAISVTATGIASVGAGPFREVTRTWRWDAASASYIPAEERLHPSNFRIHVLHDADDAAQRGDYQAALDLYSRVIEDEGLDDWEPIEGGRTTLAAYAMFRRVLTELQLGDPSAARAAYEVFRVSFTPNISGHPFVEMGEAFWDAYQQSGDLGEACSEAKAYATFHAPEILDALSYGYANRAYSADDVCPAES